MNCNVEITAVGTADGLEVSIHGGSVGMMTAAELGLTIRLWRDVKRNEPMKREHLNLIYDVAIHAAVEAIQLAAMVKKYERSQRHDWPGGWVPDYGTGPEPLKKKGGETV